MLAGANALATVGALAAMIGVVSIPQPAPDPAPPPLTPLVEHEAMVPVVVSAGLLMSPPPKTLARLVNVPEAPSATDTGSVNVLLAPAAKPVARVQVAVSFVLVVVDTEHVQSAPSAPPAASGATNDMPAGRMSFIVVTAVVAAPPLLVTVNV